jgi:hypothetical protein
VIPANLEPRERYSPHLRTALLFTGSGTAGAYHAGVLRALQEAGVKIDIVGGCGMGVATALFAAVDASSQLSDTSGFWRSAASAHLYRPRLLLKVLAGCLALSLLCVAVPLAGVVVGLLVFPAAFLLGMVGISGGEDVVHAFVRALSGAFEPGSLPAVLPRVAVLGLLAAVLVVLAAAFRARRRLKRRGERAGFWWLGLDGFLDASGAVSQWRHALWRALAGGPLGRQPADRDLSVRYTELLADNLGQPGFRELLLVVHDTDARRDLVFCALVERLRREFLARRTGATARAGEAFDLLGMAREQLIDVLAAALSLPVATEPHLLRFGADTYWRGETHRVTNRPESIARLIEEAGEAGATQIIIVSGVPEPPGPHGLRERRADPRSRLGDYLTSAEGAAIRDAVRAANDASRLVFLIQPGYSPLNALDFGGCHDKLSDREYPLSELLERGYEDTHRQFIEPVVAAGGEKLDARKELT